MQQRHEPKAAISSDDNREIIRAFGIDLGVLSDDRGMKAKLSAMVA